MSQELPDQNLTPVDLNEDLVGYRPGALNWKHVHAALLKKEKGVWHRLIHNYPTANSARSSVSRAARSYNFEYRVTVNSPQENGLIGVFVRIPKETE